MYDVLIVGAGPCGLIAGKEIAKQGYKACIIEEHQEIGYPVQCSGLYSISGLKRLGLELDESIISNTIKGGRFYSPSCKELLAYSDMERARVVEKKLFDKFLAKEAARTGCEIKLKTKVTGVEIKDNVLVNTSGIDGNAVLKSKLLIGADGIRSNIARWGGLPTPKKVVAAAQVEVENADVERDVAEVYFGREYAPNFYAWVLPKENVYEVGVGVRGQRMLPREYLMKFMKKHPVASKKIKSRSILEVNIGGFPVETVQETVAERTMIVGDAAGQTKASTGGGVITGGIASMIAARAAVKALEEENFSKEFLKREYEEKWKADLGLEFQVHSALRRMFDSLSDSQVDYLFDLAIRARLSEVMVKYRDTDRPSEFVKELLNSKIGGAFKKFLSI